MPLTIPPTPPSRADSANFSTRGDAFMSYVPTLVDELNALIIELSGYASSASGSASAASSSASSASASASAASSALSAVSSAVGLNTVAVTGTSQAATAGNLYVLQNASSTTVTLPASPANGDVVSVMVANGRIDNVISRNGKQIQGLAEDLTLDNASASVLLRYVDATSQWRLV